MRSASIPGETRRPLPVEIAVHAVRKRYGATEVLRGVDFSVARGEVFGLLGPNGAGKTTILNCIAGLLTPDAGEVRFDSSRGPADPRSIIGFAAEQLGLPDAITPREALRFFAALHGRRISTEAGLAQFGLRDNASVPVRALSQGLRQRLNLALALVHEPRVVLLDEPTNGLDPNAREQLFREIARMAEGGRAVVVATHSMEEAEQHCDRVAVLDRGEVIAEGAPAEIVAQSGIHHRVRLETSAPPAPDWIGGLPGVSSFDVEGQRVECRTAQPTILVPALLRMLDERRMGLVQLHVEQPTLRDAYRRLTGGRRDE